MGTLPTGTWQAVFALACSPDGRVLATGSANEYEKEGAIRLWDARTLRELPGRLSNLGDGGSSNGPVYGIAFSADGRLMAAGTSYCLYTWYLG